MKRILSALLIFVLFVSLFTISASAYSDPYALPTLTGDKRQDFVSIALSQSGYSEDASGNSYFGAYFGNPSGNWCVYFINWCARQAGLSTSQVPNVGSVNELKSNSTNVHTRGDGYVPKVGDIAMLCTCGSWNSAHTDHAGVVYKVENGYAYLCEGNTSNRVRTDFRYSLSTGFNYSASGSKWGLVNYYINPFSSPETGDINFDGKINAADVILIQRYNAGWYSGMDLGAIPFYINAADLNSDSKTNALDTMILQRHNALWQEYESLPI